MTLAQTGLTGLELNFNSGGLSLYFENDFLVSRDSFLLFEFQSFNLTSLKLKKSLIVFQSFDLTRVLLSIVTKCKDELN